MTEENAAPYFVTATGPKPPPAQAQAPPEPPSQNSPLADMVIGGFLFVVGCAVVVFVLMFLVKRIWTIGGGDDCTTTRMPDHSSLTQCVDENGNIS